MPDFGAKIHQIQFPLGLRSRPRWRSLYSAPHTPYKNSTPALGPSGLDTTSSPDSGQHVNLQTCQFVIYSANDLRLVLVLCDVYEMYYVQNIFVLRLYETTSDVQLSPHRKSNYKLRLRLLLRYTTYCLNSPKYYKNEILLGFQQKVTYRPRLHMLD